LANFALRLALTTHTGIPRENGIDPLAEAEQDFAPPKPEKSAGKKKVATKKAAKAGRVDVARKLEEAIFARWDAKWAALPSA
jgi:hypothetical protein